MTQHLRIFVSSPGDVPDERLRADVIADKLSQEYSRFFTIESYRWEHEAMLASKHFQDAIEPPSAFDIVVLILWSRLGTPLPEQTAERDYRGIDGRTPVTGTEWEFEEAPRGAVRRRRYRGPNRRDTAAARAAGTLRSCPVQRGRGTTRSVVEGRQGRSLLCDSRLPPRLRRSGVRSSSGIRRR
jgi:hypothetical protein